LILEIGKDRSNDYTTKKEGSEGSEARVTTDKLLNRNKHSWKRRMNPKKVIGDVLISKRMPTTEVGGYTTK